MNYNIPDDNLLEILHEKIGQISNTISEFDTSFLFNSLFNEMNVKSIPISMEIVSNNRRKKTNEINLVPLLDTTGYNSGEKESFSNNISKNSVIPKDKFSQIYFASLGVLSIYVLFNIMKKTKMIPI